jgi:hypothetical protein
MGGSPFYVNLFVAVQMKTGRLAPGPQLVEPRASLSIAPGGLRATRATGKNVKTSHFPLRSKAAGGF